MPKGCTPIENILPKDFLKLSDSEDNELREQFTPASNNSYSENEPNSELISKNNSYGENSDDIETIFDEISEKTNSDSSENGGFLSGIKNNVWTIIILIIIFMVMTSGIVLNLFSNSMPNFGLTKNCLDGTLSPTFQGNLVIGSIIAVIFIIIKKIIATDI